MVNSFLSQITYCRLLAACWQYAGLSGQRQRMVVLYGLLFTANLVLLSRPLIVGEVVVTLLAGGPHLFAHLSLWLGGYVASMALYLAIVSPAWRMERRFSVALRQAITETVYDDIGRLPWAWHQANHSGETLARLTKARDALHEFADSQFEYLNTFMYLGGSIAALYWLAPEVGIVLSLVLMPLYCVVRRFDLASMRLKEEANQLDRELSATLTDQIGNIGTQLALGGGQPARLVMGRQFLLFNRVLDRTMQITVRKWGIFLLVLNAAIAGSLLFFLLRQADLQAAIAGGMIVTVFQYLQQIDLALEQYAISYQTLLRNRVDLDAVLPIRQAAAAAPARLMAAATDWQSARLRHVDFSYEDGEHHVHHLSDVSLELARGRRIALVGASGAGKSTLLRLLRGLQPPLAGTLQLDGVAQPDFRWLRQASTLILQDAEIFDNTLRYNLNCGHDVSDAALAEAIRLAGLEPVLAGLPQGLDTDIRERGNNLSGGQKQRLALARGLFAARDSSLLLLDEPTSSLDPATEAQVFTGLLSGFPEACIVASVHRLHLLDRFDLVYVMDRGRIVEAGSFAELLAVRGKLYRLWQAQQAKKALTPEPQPAL